MQSSVLALLPLDANLGGGVSIAITSLVFGVLHMTSPASFIWATAGGVILGDCLLFIERVVVEKAQRPLVLFVDDYLPLILSDGVIDDGNMDMVMVLW